MTETVVHPTIEQYDDKGNFIPVNTSGAQIESLTKFMTSKGYMMVSRKHSVGFVSFLDNNILNAEHAGRKNMSFVNAVRWHNSSRSNKFKFVKRVKLADHGGQIVTLNHLVRSV